MGVQCGSPLGFWCRESWGLGPFAPQAPTQSAGQCLLNAEAIFLNQ